ncbi:ABC transporter substrate-binding protein [Actinocrispum wychmicini]|uniref:ABC transporter substrate-binding protein n=1 Tax=Actinocrispum wychmicini TaxID=1213861 RepID=UPI00104761F7|nr:ABC transporter substrate-binding protein [Actinocrispum wychmicini]
MKTLLSRVIALTTVAVALAACGSTKDSGAGTVIRVGTLGDAPPNVYQENGQYTGFDNELLKAVAGKVGLTPEFVGTDFSALLGQVGNRTFDVGSSAIAATEERKKNVDFSDSYDFEYMSILTTDGAGVSDENSLKGKRVAVIQATVGDNYLTKQLPEAQAVRFPTYDAGIAALKSGGVQAFVLDLTIAKKYAADNGFKVTKAITTDVPHGFAVRKGNTELRDKLNSGLKQVIADGTWLKLHDKFIPDTPVPAQFKPGA